MGYEGQGGSAGSGWLTRMEFDARRVADHPFAVDLTTATGLAASACLGWRSRTGSALSRWSSACCCARRCCCIGAIPLCFALVALVAFAQWLLAAPQLADAAVLIALYWVALKATSPRSLSPPPSSRPARSWRRSAGRRQPLKIWVGLSGLAIAAGVLGVTVRQRRALLVSLHERAARLESSATRRVASAAAAERARIAREMHDIVAHNLSVMIALADGASYTMASSPSARARRPSGSPRPVARRCWRCAGCSACCARTPPSSRSRHSRASIVSTSCWRRCTPPGSRSTMDLDGDPQELPDGVQLTVFRVAQEALTNTLKHAARPTRAHLALRCQPRSVELEVTDTGSRRRADRQAIARRSGRGLQRHARARRGLRRQARCRPAPGWRLARAPAARPDAESAPDEHRACCWPTTRS